MILSLEGTQLSFKINSVLSAVVQSPRAFAIKSRLKMEEAKIDMPASSVCWEIVYDSAGRALIGQLMIRMLTDLSDLV